MNPVGDLSPPEEMIKINLTEMARKTSDQFSLSSGLTRTYRLKVLLDMNSNVRRSKESSNSKGRFDMPYNHQDLSLASSHKPYVVPPRSRARHGSRPDSFRSRPQNTSRPPSIHVDDFVDIYSESSNQSRYAGGSSSGGKHDSRGGSSGRSGYHPPIAASEMAPDHGGSHRHAFMGPQQAPSHSSSPYSSRSQHIGGGGGKSKYAKLK